MRFYLAVAAILVTALFLGSAKGSAPTGFTGNDYLALPESAKAGYAVGLLHGMLIGAVFVAQSRDDRFYKAMETCLTNMTGGQVEAIIGKYMTDHPEQWNVAMVLISERAFGATCKPYIVQ